MHGCRFATIISMIKKLSTISIFSYPKVNLALDICEKDESGYHEILTVFHELKFPFDELIIEECDGEAVEVLCDNPRLPTDETNTVTKAAMLLQAQMDVKKGAKIFIKKKIPLMSGLGGGSSNAVAVLKALTELWKFKCCEIVLGIHSNDCILKRLSTQIGMDCPFFFNGGTALGSHFGERLIEMPLTPKEIKFEIIETGVEISSREAYSQIDLKNCGRNIAETKSLIAALRACDREKIVKNLHNDFEDFAFAKYPALLEIKRKIESEKPGRVLLCGSGGALFRVYS